MSLESNREKIVETALELFNQRGCKGVTMDDVAGALRISKRTLYETFESKESLLTVCLERVHDLTNQRHCKAHSMVDEPLLVALYMLRTNALYVKKYCRLIDEMERYYPDIYDKFFKVHTNEMREVMQRGFDYTQQQGYLRQDANLTVAVDFFCNLLQRHRLTQTDNWEEYVGWINEVCFTYLRGLLSVDTIIRFENKLDFYREVVESLEEQD